MAYLLIRQKFADYSRWREAFESLAEQRKGLGLETVLVTRNTADPDEAVILFRFEDVEQVRRHFPSPQLEAAWRQGGVIEGTNQVTFLDEVD
ncbi:hypothetical protein ABZO31_10345 [Streptomyces sp. HUAS MG47]|uniref:hypothetical protein n=1 Tax=Streptomyces solicamelliae TaxID=3231716 RepID=UPI0038779FBB